MSPSASLYSLRLLLGAGVTMAALIGVLGNLLFNRVPRLSSQNGPALGKDEAAEPARR